MVEAMRAGESAVVKGVSAKGTQTTDTFSLKGLSQALDRTEQECKRVENLGRVGSKSSPGLKRAEGRLGAGSPPPPFKGEELFMPEARQRRPASPFGLIHGSACRNPA